MADLQRTVYPYKWLYPSAAGPVQTSESSPIRDRRSTTEPPNQTVVVVVVVVVAAAAATSTYQRTASVYSHATLHVDTSLSRRDEVLLAQLRSGHCHKLAAYHNVIDPTATADPVCRRCSLAQHILEQECPATASQRLQSSEYIADPSLSILVTNQQEVILFARETLPRYVSSYILSSSAAAVVGPVVVM